MIILIFHLRSISVLHDIGLTHTDLKPENILFVNSDYSVLKKSKARVTADWRTECWPLPVTCCCNMYMCMYVYKVLHCGSDEVFLMIYRLAPYWRVRCYRMRCWLFNYTVCVCDAACCIVCKPRSTCTSCTDSCTPLKLLCHHWWLDFKLYAWIVKTFRTAVHVQGMPSHPVLSAPQLILYMWVCMIIQFGTVVKLLVVVTLFCSLCPVDSLAW